MITNKQAKMLSDTWRTIHYHLGTIDWSNYGDKLLKLTLEESKSHDGFRADHIRRGINIQQEAKYFAIKRLWEYLGDEKAPNPKEYLMMQNSCFAAYCIMTNDRFADARRKFIGLSTMKEIASWDYCDLISDEKYSPGYSPDERRGFKRSPVEV